MRLRIDLGYDGQAFSGWAKQPNRPSVQDSLESALATVFRLERDQVKTVVAGRTDAGVHAVGQVCHVDLPEGLGVGIDNAVDWALVTKRLRGALGKENHVWIHEVSEAPEGFDARFSPVARRYEYRIADKEALHDPRLAGHTVWREEALDMSSMNTLGKALLGLHDFAAFCRAREGATTIRELQDFSWLRDDQGVLVGRVVADAFCHSMVRSLVGAAVAVGTGQLSSEEVLALRQEGARTSAWKTMPAHGLTLMEISYPEPGLLGQRAQQTRAPRHLPAD